MREQVKVYNHHNDLWEIGKNEIYSPSNLGSINDVFLEPFNNIQKLSIVCFLVWQGVVHECHKNEGVRKKV